jgi:transcriptional regulator with XRE-family HTH domain
MPKRKSSIDKSRDAFAVRLRKMRMGAGLTQKDLERLSGIPKSRISRYENGHLLPSFQGLGRLARSLGVAESALLGESEEPGAAFTAGLRRRGVEFASVSEADEASGRVADFLDQEERDRAQRRGQASS